MLFCLFSFQTNFTSFLDWNGPSIGFLPFYKVPTLKLLFYYTRMYTFQAEIRIRHSEKYELTFNYYLILNKLKQKKAITYGDVTCE